jgi:hypothetical protein
MSGNYMKFLKAAHAILKRKNKVPADYMKMVQTEYRTVPLDYIQFFLEQHNRLPNLQELNNAI